MSTAPRKSRERARPGEVSFPIAPAKAGLPSDYAALLATLWERIASERLRVTLAANSALVLLYWEIGRAILAKQENEGWGAKVIDRLSTDLRETFPDMNGLSPRNLKYMRKFAETWPDGAIVQRVVAQLPWRSNLTLLERVSTPADRLLYARQTLANVWSSNILALQIQGRLHKCLGKPVNNFALALPPPDSDMAAQIFKDPYLFDFLGTADPRKEREAEKVLVEHIQRNSDDLLRHSDDKPSIGLLLCKGKDRVVAEYSLQGFNRPIGVADWEKQLTASLPKELEGTLPSIAEIEAELSDPIVPNKPPPLRKTQKKGNTQ